MAGSPELAWGAVFAVLGAATGSLAAPPAAHRTLDAALTLLLHPLGRRLTGRGLAGATATGRRMAKRRPPARRAGPDRPPRCSG